MNHRRPSVRSHMLLPTSTPFNFLRDFSTQFATISSLWFSGRLFNGSAIRFKWPWFIVEFFFICLKGRSVFDSFSSDSVECDIVSILHQFVAIASFAPGIEGKLNIWNYYFLGQDEIWIYICQQMLLEQSYIFSARWASEVWISFYMLIWTWGTGWDLGLGFRFQEKDNRFHLYCFWLETCERRFICSLRLSFMTRCGNIVYTKNNNIRNSSLDSYGFNLGMANMFRAIVWVKVWVTKPVSYLQLSSKLAKRSFVNYAGIYGNTVVAQFGC